MNGFHIMRRFLCFMLFYFMCLGHYRRLSSCNVYGIDETFVCIFFFREILKQQCFRGRIQDWLLIWNRKRLLSEIQVFRFTFSLKLFGLIIFEVDTLGNLFNWFPDMIISLLFTLWQVFHYFLLNKLHGRLIQYSIYPHFTHLLLYVRWT